MIRCNKTDLKRISNLYSATMALLDNLVAVQDAKNQKDYNLAERYIMLQYANERRVRKAAKSAWPVIRGASIRGPKDHPSHG